MFLFFFKQKTAYEMRISDWSSDVCSSDLGEQWRDMWMERLEHLEPLIVTILENQAYGDFWRERAVTDFSRIKCPVYAVSGWADASYVGAVFQTIQAVDVPWKALVGPWGHQIGRAHV